MVCAFVGAAGLIGLEVFLHHPQSQFGEPHSTRPTSLVTRVVLTLPTNQTDERGAPAGAVLQLCGAQWLQKAKTRRK